jgi:hypothetical protein
MTKTKRLFLAVSVAVFALSVITLVRVPVVVQATDCTSWGDDAAALCLNNFPEGGSMCWNCVSWYCSTWTEEMECYNTCHDRGVQVCGGG